MTLNGGKLADTIIEPVDDLLSALRGAGRDTDALTKLGDDLATMARLENDAVVAKTIGEIRTTIAIYLLAAAELLEAGGAPARADALVDRGRTLAIEQLIEFIRGRADGPGRHYAVAVC